MKKGLKHQAQRHFILVLRAWEKYMEEQRIHRMPWVPGQGVRIVKPKGSYKHHGWRVD
jgi:hypothetical protein